MSEQRRLQPSTGSVVAGIGGGAIAAITHEEDTQGIQSASGSYESWLRTHRSPHLKPDTTLQKRIADVRDTYALLHQRLPPYRDAERTDNPEAFREDLLQSLDTLQATNPAYNEHLIRTADSLEHVIQSYPLHELKDQWNYQLGRHDLRRASEEDVQTYVEQREKDKMAEQGIHGELQGTATGLGVLAGAILGYAAVKTYNAIRR